jgi:hypothetical protein
MRRCPGFDKASEHDIHTGEPPNNSMQRTAPRAAAERPADMPQPRGPVAASTRVEAIAGQALLRFL